jgi:hypothetical protein
MATPAACNTKKLVGVIRGTNAVIKFSGSTLYGIVGKFQFQYQRQISKVFDLASPDYYYIEGTPNGQLQLDTVVGPKGLISLACTCEAETITIACNTRCGNEIGKQVGYVFKDCLPTAVAGQEAIDDFLFRVTLTYTFNDVEPIEQV